MKKELITLAVPDKIRAALSAKDFQVRIKATADEVEVLVFDYIGEPGTNSNANDFAAILSQNRGKPVNVRINSFGGLAYDGIAMFNALIQHDAKVTTTIEGMAGSAASILAMGGRVRMFENSNLFVHRAMGVAIGNRDASADMVDWLDKIDDQIARVYAAKSGRQKTTMLNMMRGKVDGTVMNAKEAKEAGLIDEVLPVKPSETNDAPAVGDDAAAEQAEALRNRIAAVTDVDVRLRLMELEGA